MLKSRASGKERAGMKKKLLSNWGLKLASLLLAFVVWLVVINIADPVDEKSFVNVKVTLKNTQLITDKNMVYEILEGTDVVKNVRVSAARTIIEELSQTDIVAEADFANLTVNDTIEIKFYSSRANDSIKTIVGSTEMVKLNVEDKRTKYISLTAQTTGEPQEGYMIGNVSMDQNRIEVAGAESLVSKISTASVIMDVSDSSEDISIYADVLLYDAEGNVINAESLLMKTKSVRVSAQILATKDVPLIFQTMGNPAQGYMATGMIESTVQKVQIAGASAVLAGISEISIPEEALNITGQNVDLLATIDVRDYLPDNVVLTEGFNGKVTVTVYIEPIKTRELEIVKDNIRILGLPRDFTAEIEDSAEVYVIKVSGLNAQIDTLNPAIIYGSVQIADYMVEEEIDSLQPGTYLVPVSFNLAEDITLLGELQVHIKISGSEE